ncbi:hypothetical protein ADIARSV_0559 [Arcticibacter svalbardensis MN12-7]|uniref:Uncharacterized protein n=1 Tax=Arcticibacter svalbardensis MN12-7 TaxID=1150600 RepID=R9H569_9SPHI|nr:hypothetical protein [Arcticibacter svalbardensis]EOR96324.1 hypothetical protein ADIARSV_0559 [Arcticibacter svalbardensis MN12-7]
MSNNVVNHNEEFLEIQIALSDESPAGLTELKKHITKQEIKGVIYVEVLRDTVKTGQMGIGVNMNALGATIKVLEGSVVQLVNCLQKYVDNYITSITVTTKEGIVIEISHGRSLNQNS